ncbi:MAG: hypothetical protein M1820_009844 [Bogoriella megaspora]|nr:MAG: hypothetical protein M1820_009844 [Bogoriella megaspora]
MNCASTLTHKTSSSTFSLPLRIWRRTEATGRRHRARLRIKPDPAFAQTLPSQDHIIYNPPSSSPSVYHTPPKFLPKTDKRRLLYESTSRPSTTPSSSPSASTTPLSSTESDLPPPLRPQNPKQYHLTHDDFTEIRRLRLEDPLKWTNVALARKFKCSTVLIPMICKAPKEVREGREKELEEIKKKWGPRRREAREERGRRREGWGRDG